MTAFCNKYWITTLFATSNVIERKLRHVIRISLCPIPNLPAEYNLWLGHSVSPREVCSRILRSSGCVRSPFQFQMNLLNNQIRNVPLVCYSGTNIENSNWYQTFNHDVIFSARWSRISLCVGSCATGIESKWHCVRARQIRIAAITWK